MSDKQKAIVYVDIESLLDIRQGFLYNQTDKHDELASYVISDEYNYRDHDHFEKFTMVDYRDYMRNPSIDILGASLITYNLGLVLSRLNGGESRDKYKGETSIPELWFNYYPFTLTPEQKEHIRDLLFVKLGRQHFIEMIRMAPSEVTPALIKDGGFVSAFIYDFSTWMDCNGPALQNTQIHDCPVYFAPVYKVRPSKEDLEFIKKTGFQDSFNYMEFIMSPLIKATFLPMAFYSNIIVARKHVEEYHQSVKEKISKKSEGIKVPEELLKNVDLSEKV